MANAQKMLARQRWRRTRRVRNRLRGKYRLVARPRLSVFRSHKHIYAQLIDDTRGHTLAAASTLDKELREKIAYGGNQDAARAVGQLIAQRALAAGVKEVVFDRGPYKYHGRVKALADAAREAGLEF